MFIVKTSLLISKITTHSLKERASVVKGEEIRKKNKEAFIFHKITLQRRI